MEKIKVKVEAWKDVTEQERIWIEIDAEPIVILPWKSLKLCVHPKVNWDGNVDDPDSQWCEWVVTEVTTGRRIGNPRLSRFHAIEEARWHIQRKGIREVKKIIKLLQLKQKQNVPADQIHE